MASDERPRAMLEFGGLCGDPKGSFSSNVLVGPEGCHYDLESQGQLYTAAWVPTDDLETCKPTSTPEVRGYLEEVEEYQKTCVK